MVATHAVGEAVAVGVEVVVKVEVDKVDRERGTHVGQRRWLCG